MILIRSDGNARIGAGHLMRCMTVAEELTRLQGGGNICFVCAEEASAAIVRERGMEAFVLGTDYREMEAELPRWREIWNRFGLSGKPPEKACQESGKTGNRIREEGDCANRDRKKAESGTTAVSRPAVTVLVDSYYVTDSYLAALEKTAYTILMDDIGEHPYPVDCVINYNAPARLEAYRRLYPGEETRLLIGSAYIPLREQFRGVADSFIPREVPMGQRIALLTPDSGEENGVEEEPARPGVLLTAGGGESGGIAGQILERIYTDAFTFHLVTGRFFSGVERLRQLEQTHPNIHIHHDVKNMAELMRGCQLAVTAGGSTVYELAALGIPFICFSCAENQEALVEYLDVRKMAASAGAWHREPKETLDRIEALFSGLAGSAEMQAAFHAREKELTDGKGAERLAGEISKTQL